jgi:hypothetical protein
MKDGQTIGQWLNWDFKTNLALGTVEVLEIKDKRGNNVYHESLNGFWVKREFDSQGNQIYFENSVGEIIDNRIPEIIEHNGYKYQLIPNQNQNP